MPSAQKIVRPILYVIAGANGSGKSTFTQTITQTLQVPVIDPDQEARIIRPDAPEKASVEAGRRAIRRSHLYLASGQSFAIETTLAGKTQLRLMQEAKNTGYNVDFVYIGVENVDICVERVALRVAKGGHNVPAVDIRRRYKRGLEQLPTAIQLAHHTILYDNSTEQGYTKLLAIEDGVVTAQISELPLWIIGNIQPFLMSLAGYVPHL